MTLHHEVQEWEAYNPEVYATTRQFREGQLLHVKNYCVAKVMSKKVSGFYPTGITIPEHGQVLVLRWSRWYKDFVYGLTMFGQ